MKRYNDRYDHGFVFTKPHKEIAFGAGSSVTDADADTAIMVANGADHTRLTIGGEVAGSYFGIYSSADHIRLVLRSGASVAAETAILMNGRKQSLDNAGTIEADGIGVLMTGPHSHTANHGTIAANVGILLQYGENGLVLNGRDGEIHAAEHGVIFGGVAADSVNTLVNLGTIASTGFAFLGSVSIDRVVNRGTIDGDIYLYNGKDRFDGRHGETLGEVHGGPGNDTYLIDDPLAVLVEDADIGRDTVISSVTYGLAANFENLKLTGRADIAGHGNGSDNRLTGNAGDNMLSGYGGQNVLSGLGGNDRLVGGGEQDTFVFRTGGDRDVIENFQDNVDLLDLRGWKGLADFDVLLSHAQEKNGDLIITYRGDQLIIENFTKTQFDPGDFAV